MKINFWNRGFIERVPFREPIPKRLDDALDDSNELTMMMVPNDRHVIRGIPNTLRETDAACCPDEIKIHPVSFLFSKALNQMGQDHEHAREKSKTLHLIILFHTDIQHFSFSGDFR